MLWLAFGRGLLRSACPGLAPAAAPWLPAGADSAFSAAPAIADTAT